MPRDAMTLSTVSRLITNGLPLWPEEMSALCGLAMWAGMLEEERDALLVGLEEAVEALDNDDAHTCGDANDLGCWPCSCAMRAQRVRWRFMKEDEP